jgi:hypothetical protein
MRKGRNAIARRAIMNIDTTTSIRLMPDSSFLMWFT